MTYETKGVCSRSIDIETDGTKIKSVAFTGGCPGNALGISQLITGMEIKDVISRFKGVKCGEKPTSCPDQLAIALSKIEN